MPRSTSRGGRNNNPQGRNQYSGGVMEMAREKPFTTALGAAAAVGAGVFLWSRRNQISEQLSGLSDQINEWKESYSNEDFGSEALIGSGSTGSSTNLGTKSRRNKDKTQAEISQEALSLKETSA